MDEDLEVQEEELFSILRFHNDDVKVSITFGPDYGSPFYYCKMTVCNKEYISQGRNLCKRYKEFVAILKNLYGSNIYEYGTKPVGQ